MNSVASQNRADEAGDNIKDIGRLALYAFGASGIIVLGMFFVLALV